MRVATLAIHSSRPRWFWATCKWQPEGSLLFASGQPRWVLYRSRDRYYAGNHEFLQVASVVDGTFTPDEVQLFLLEGKIVHVAYDPFYPVLEIPRFGIPVELVDKLSTPVISQDVHSPRTMVCPPVPQPMSAIFVISDNPSMKPNAFRLFSLLPGPCLTEPEKKS
jgi:hypothetical protein